jgi:hypothetical protein
VLGVRRDRWWRLSAFLASRGDAELAATVDTSRADGAGVGRGYAALDVDGEPVFVKRVETQSFPILYHWRVLPGRSPIAAEHADIDAAVAALDGSPAVRDRLDALAAATHSLVLFCEHIPYPVLDWLRDDPVSKAADLEQQLTQIVTFLHDRDLLHMDGHFDNLRTDGSRIYLTDFGLATSPHFDLSPTEHNFAERHATHDADYASMRLVNWLVTAICGVPVPDNGKPTARNDFVRRCAAGYIPNDIPPIASAILTRHAPTAATMNAFYWKLFDGETYTEYPER